MKKPTILIVEDSPTNIQVLGRVLKNEGYELAIATDGKEGLQVAMNIRPDLILLDIMMPVMDGIESCKRLKKYDQTKDIPVIFLTAKDQEKDEIEGLELGADDYISKPASLNLVKAHVETLLRRQDPQKSNWLQYGDLYLDVDGKELYHKDRRIELTSTEFTLIKLFFQNPKHVYSRQNILEKIGDDDKFVFDRTVDVHIKNLRLKLGEASDIIKTYRGLGYGLNREIVTA